MVLRLRGIRGFVALGRKDTATGKGGDKFPATQRMRRTMNSKRGRKTYRMRKHIVEAPFGWIKQVLGISILQSPWNRQNLGRVVTRVRSDQSSSDGEDDAVDVKASSNRPANHDLDRIRTTEPNLSTR